MKVKVLITLIFLLLAISLSAYQWPVKPQDSQHGINATLGEWRDGHFHAGVDINEALDSIYCPATSIVDTTELRHYWIGKFRYIHVILLDFPHDTTLYPGDNIGYITGSHLHFRERSSDFMPWDNSDALNPLFPGALSPYVDYTNPHIDSIKFYRQGSSAQLNADSLSGKVDILSVAGDTRTDATGHSAGHNVSVYRIGYEVKDTLGNIVKPYWEKIIFDTIDYPGNTSQLNLTYATGSNYDPPHFRYWVTNDPFNDTVALRNWYWNTKQKEGAVDSIDANSIEEAEYKDDYYWVKVKAYDIRENYKAKTVRVIVANFRPKVKYTDPYNGQNNVCLDQKIHIAFSENMNKRVDLNSAISISPGVSGDFEWMNDNEIEFTPDPAFIENTAYTISLSDQLKDLQDQKLIPYTFSFTTGSSSGPQVYPTAFQWENIISWDVSVDFRTNYYFFQIFEHMLFPFYGQYYDFIFISRRGSIWFDNYHDTPHFNLPTADGDPYGVIVPYNDSLCGSFVPNITAFGGSKELTFPNREVVRWRYAYTGDTTEFEAVLFANGIIRFCYRKCDIQQFFNDAGSGVSAGDGVRFQQIPTVYENVPSSYVFATDPPPGKPKNLKGVWPNRSEFVNLSWNPNPEPDLEGYNIYRRNIDSTLIEKLEFTTSNNFTDTTIQLGNTYIYRITAIDTLNLESVYSDSIIVEYGPRTSNNSLATAYNNKNSIVSSSGGDKVYFIYSSNNRIFYCSSSDSGKSFTGSTYIGEGEYPAIALDTAGIPVIVWLYKSSRNASLKLAYNDGYGWQTWSIAIEYRIDQFSPPSIAIDEMNELHFTYMLGYDGIPMKNMEKRVIDKYYLELYYGSLPVSNPSNVQKHILYSSIGNDWLFNLISSITADYNNYPHIIYANPFDGEIYYTFKNSSGWSQEENVSLTSGKSSYPSLDCYESKLTFAWQEDNSVILSRYRTLPNGVWSTTSNVSGKIEDSKFPFINSGYYCVWQSESGISPKQGMIGITDIYWSKYDDVLNKWSYPENISNSDLKSTYPHCVYVTENKEISELYCLWTEGDSIPYDIKFSKTGTMLKKRNKVVGVKIKSMVLSEIKVYQEGSFLNIRFISHDASDTKIELFDITGRLLYSLIIDKVKIGTNKTNISLHNISSGIYFIRIENCFDKLIKKVIVLK
jgi:hypothetical protein